MEDIARHTAATIGSEKFGVPRVLARRMPRIPPVELLHRFWNPIRNFLVLNVKEPMQWLLVLSLAAQKAIVADKDTLDPALAARLIMESAVAMAKLDPARVRHAYFQTTC